MEEERFTKRIDSVVEQTFGEGGQKITMKTPRVGEERLPGSKAGRHKVAIGSDHRGYALKQQLAAYLGDLGHVVVDCGIKEGEVGDYPDIALAVSDQVARKKCDFGIVIDAVGIGSAIAANKIKGIRAATCHDVESAKSSRLHNDANVLSLGSNFLNRGLARRMVRTWLETPFEGGRHVKRIEKIGKIEKDGLDARL
jgi:ribose 5-phosphate isomerase B